MLTFFNFNYFTKLNEVQNDCHRLSVNCVGYTVMYSSLDEEHARIQKRREGGPRDIPSDSPLARLMNPIKSLIILKRICFHCCNMLFLMKKMFTFVQIDQY